MKKLAMFAANYILGGIILNTCCERINSEKKNEIYVDIKNGAKTFVDSELRAPKDASEILQKVFIYSAMPTLTAGVFINALVQKVIGSFKTTSGGEHA